MDLVTGRRGRTRADRSSLQRGFTLIELMVTISVMAILLAIGVPYFGDATLGSKLGSYANNLAASAYLARSEALKRNVPVTLCASSDGTNCVGGWEQGWIVVAAGTVIQSQPALSAGVKIFSNPVTTSFAFSPTGVSSFGITDTALTVCRLTPTPGKQERVVRIRVTGLPSVTRTTTGVCS